MKVAVILGRHEDVWNELERAKAMIKEVGAELWVIATKRAGRDYDGPVHEWPGFHPELLQTFVNERAKNNRPPALRYWSAKSSKVNPGQFGLPIEWLTSVGGSSGLLGIQVADAIGRHPKYANEPKIDKSILCGIPMTPSTRYDDGKEWKEAIHYRDHWLKYFIDHPDSKARLRSFSGWTKEILGEPTLEWLREPLP